MAEKKYFFVEEAIEDIAKTDFKTAYQFKKVYEIMKSLDTELCVALYRRTDDCAKLVHDMQLYLRNEVDCYLKDYKLGELIPLDNKEACREYFAEDEAKFEESLE